MGTNSYKEDYFKRSPSIDICDIWKQEYLSDLSVSNFYETQLYKDLWNNIVNYFTNSLPDTKVSVTKSELPSYKLNAIPAFVVGDEVECIDVSIMPYNEKLTLGKLYTVLEISSACSQIKVKNDSGDEFLYMSWRFRKPIDYLQIAKDVCGKT